jgi:hypothetical protein
MSAIGTQAGLHELFHLLLGAFTLIVGDPVDAIGRFEFLACHFRLLSTGLLSKFPMGHNGFTSRFG